MIRLLLDGAHDGDWNMAVDQALMEAAGESDAMILRFYRWSEPTLSLGYFQSHRDRQGHGASCDCVLIRRSSGGGAILHDQELTYSLSMPIANRWARDACQMYHTVHETLAASLARWNVTAEHCTSIQVDLASQSEPPFLCFARRSETDLLIGNDKIAGSAQRKRLGSIVQHGSVLLSQSESAPELPGIAQITGCQIDPALLAERWSVKLAQALGLELHLSQLLPAESQRATELVSTKYGNSDWTGRR